MDVYRFNGKTIDGATFLRLSQVAGMVRRTERKPRYTIHELWTAGAWKHRESGIYKDPDTAKRHFHHKTPRN